MVQTAVVRSVMAELVLGSPCWANKRAPSVGVASVNILGPM